MFNAEKVKCIHIHVCVRRNILGHLHNVGYGQYHEVKYLIVKTERCQFLKIQISHKKQLQGPRLTFLSGH